MRLDRYFAKSRILDLRSGDFGAALGELLAALPAQIFAKRTREQLRAELLERERTMTSYLGNGVGLPHLRVPMKCNYIFVVGRCPHGLEFNGGGDYKNVRLVFLMLAGEKEKSYLTVLASLARVFEDRALLDRLAEAPDLEAFQQAVKQVFRGGAGRTDSHESKFNRLILNVAAKVARGARCSTIMVFGDTFAGGVDLTHAFGSLKTILVTQTAQEVAGLPGVADAIIPVRSFSNNRLGQLRSAVLIGLTRGIIRNDERLCCLGGIPASNQFDTVVVVDVEREFQSVFTRQADMLPEAVKPEVLERVLGVATELAIEGREGRPVGCLFVLGESEKIQPYIKPLVLNPFFGYKEEDRNILNPFMDETVKEFSSLDGAFIIRGDGVLVSAGSLIHAPDYAHQLPSGLGSRHAAACAISLAADCLAIVVSASTGQVTLFRRGQWLPLTERGINRNL
jgi:DNA integrity scanning protein DisA with diadenylate cyclase activity/mannitol/fructose-specific phosphotransferase system IIA component (Ntr-type)